MEFDEVQRAARTLQLNWCSKQFAGKSVAEITAHAVSKARDACAAETFTRGKPRKDKKTGEIIPPKEYRRSGATVNRYIATLSHLLFFAVKERRLIDRNPVGDIRRKKEPKGRTRFLSDEERAALLHACAKSEWVPLHALVLLAITTGARRGELVSLKWADVDLKAGCATIHDRYIDRNGRLEIETDGSYHLKGKGIEKDLTDDWDLDSANAQGRGPYRGKAGRKPARLVHNVILSMPKGTPPEKLLLASRDFTREQFALKHRYALAMHTDQDHPHVHLVIKAVSEDGKRLNIRKATLREWRGLFAQHLRAHGIAANATERAVRGQARSSFKDAIHRTALRGDSRYLRERVQRIAEGVRDGGLKPDPGKTKLLETRSEVIAGWHAVADALLAAGQGAIAEKIWGFIGGMHPPLTTDEQLVSKLEERTSTREPERHEERTR